MFLGKYQEGCQQSHSVLGFCPFEGESRELEFAPIGKYFTRKIEIMGQTIE